LKGDDRSATEPSSGISSAFLGLRAWVAHLTKVLSYHFWEDLKTGKT
jgi:hypothetical protein